MTTVSFRRVQCWTNGPDSSNIKPGVYVGKEWVGDIVCGSAFFPEQLEINGVLSPRFKRKPDAKGNVKRLIRDALIEWVIKQIAK